MNIKKLSQFFVILALIFLPLSTFAITENGYENELTKNTPVLEKGNLVSIIFHLIQYILAFLGVAAMVVVLYGGYTWMTSAGNDEKVSKAKKTLMAGLIGVVIVLLAYAIATFIINRVGDFSFEPKIE